MHNNKIYEKSIINGAFSSVIDKVYRNSYVATYALARMIEYHKSNKTWENKALAEMQRNRRYVWKGEKVGSEVRREFSKTNLMLISSKSEGGANVISEALAAGVPVIASNINGNIGLLGKNYLGYFNVGDERSLRTLLLKCEKDQAFLNKLIKSCKVRSKVFDFSEEERRWKRLLNEAMQK